METLTQKQTVTGTREAFRRMLEERGVSNKLDVDRSTVSNWKVYLREGKKISLEKMEEMLQRYGAKVVRDKIWEF